MIQMKSLIKGKKYFHAPEYDITMKRFRVVEFHGLINGYSFKFEDGSIDNLYANDLFKIDKPSLSAKRTIFERIFR